MTDAEKRAHDFAIAMLNIVYTQTNQNEKPNFNGYETYITVYKNALSLFNSGQ